MIGPAHINLFAYEKMLNGCLEKYLTTWFWRLDLLTSLLLRPGYICTLREGSCFPLGFFSRGSELFIATFQKMRDTSPEAFSSTLAILNKQNIHPTCDSIRFFLHQTNVPMVEPFAFKGGFEVSEPDLAVFDHFTHIPH
jgi:hypothetical protein